MLKFHHSRTVIEYVMGNMAINLSKNFYYKLTCRIAQLLSLIRDSGPCRWFMNNKNHIATALYMLWLAGSCFWVYWILTMKVPVQTTSAMMTDNPIEALVYLFFGSFGLIFVILFTSYVFRFIYNIFHGGINFILSHNLHVLVKPVCYLVLLCIAFTYTGTIKGSGIKIYHHVAHLVHTAKQKEIYVRKNPAMILELIDNRAKQ